MVYPCQRAALVTSWAFLGAPVLAAIAAGRWKRPVAWTAVALATGWAVFALGGAGLFDPDEGLPEDHWRPAKMPAWVSKDRAFEGRVVEVRDPDATSWDYVTGYYGDYVDQDIVDAMVTAGLLELTDESTVVGALRTLTSAGGTGGTRQLVWDGMDERGEKVASGVYFIRARSGTETASGKLILVK